jgi:phospho-acceptor domain-containing protein/histidine kinase/DNA gyrase B/HSP90-like ATPase
MSHELRTPLNAIIGFSEVLNERMFGELNEKQEEYLKDIHASGQHLLSLINDILDLSKIEAGRMELERSEFELPNAIENALILVRERATRRGITLGRPIDERLGMLHGDERKVKQVLLNLLSNALKFTPEGGRSDVSGRLEDGAAEIAVADTGVGIALEDQEAVFDEFRQVGTADKKVEGTGPWAGVVPEVHRAARRPDLGDERARRRLDVHFHVAAPAVTTSARPASPLIAKHRSPVGRECSSTSNTAWLRHQGLEPETDLIGAHVVSSGRVPTAQFLG